MGKLLLECDSIGKVMNMKKILLNLVEVSLLYKALWITFHVAKNQGFMNKIKP